MAANPQCLLEIIRFVLQKRTSAYNHAKVSVLLGATGKDYIAYNGLSSSVESAQANGNTKGLPRNLVRSISPAICSDIIFIPELLMVSTIETSRAGVAVDFEDELFKMSMHPKADLSA